MTTIISMTIRPHDFTDDFPRNWITKKQPPLLSLPGRGRWMLSQEPWSHMSIHLQTCFLVNIISYYHHDAGYHHKPVFQVPAWIQSSSRHAEVAPVSSKVRNCNYKINKILRVQKWEITIPHLAKSRCVNVCQLPRRTESVMNPNLQRMTDDVSNDFA